MHFWRACCALLALVLIVSGCSDDAIPTAALNDLNQSDEIAASKVEQDAGPIPGRYIVVFNDAVANIPEHAADLVRRHGGALEYTYQHALKGFAVANLPDAAVAALERNPLVAQVEPDQRVTISETQPNATWGIDRIDQRALPRDGSYTYHATGAGVTAYVIDTGIRITHNEFGGRASVGYDAIGGDGLDCHGHGTHVAGTVGGATYGVAKNVNLVAVRVLDCGGSGSWSWVIAGIDWVTANARKPAVANMSLGGGYYSLINQAVSNSIASGVSYAVAAGNENTDACTRSPASTPNAMTLGATTSSDTRSSFSNWGSCVDFFAPGSSITSAYYSGDGALATMSGTSMASPHAAGVAALYLETHQTASALEVRDALYDASTKEIVTGANSANNHLLYSLLEPGGPTNQPPTAAFGSATNYLTATFTDQSTDSDGTIAAWNWSFGDGATSTQQNPAHTYAAAGSYTVTLLVTDDGGASDQATQSVTVTAPGDPGELFVQSVIAIAQNAGGGNKQGAATVTIVNGQGIRISGVAVTGAFTGSFNDAAFGTTTNDGSVQFTTEGTKRGGVTVGFCVTDVALSGYSWADTDPVCAGDAPTNSPPTAAFTFSTSGMTATFADKSTDSDGSVVSWQWDFGDGSTSDAASPSHTYSSAGLYMVTLTITDNGGAVGSATQNVAVTDGGGGTIVLAASGSKVKGVHVVELAWIGTSAAVDVMREGLVIAPHVSGQSFTDPTGNKGGASYTYQVCESVEKTNCSNTVTVTF